MVTERYTHARCNDCGAVVPVEQLLPIDDIWERVEPGEIFPAGECPKCRATATPVLGGAPRLTLDLSTFASTGPDAAKHGRLLGQVDINGVPYHVEAYAVKITDAGEQRPDERDPEGAGELDEWLSQWWNAAGADGAFQTFAWKGREWVLFLSPYC